MTQLVLALLLGLSTFTQDEGGPPGNRQDPREREAQIVRRIGELKRQLAKSPDDEDALQELKRCEVELKELEAHSPPHEDMRDPVGRRPGVGPDMGRDLEGQLESMRDLIQQFEPDALHKLEQLRRERRFDEFNRVGFELIRHMHELRELKQRNPDEYQRRLEVSKSEQEARLIAEKACRAEGDERRRLKDQLLAHLNQLFDKREEMRGRELEDLERRVKELKETLRRRQENKSKIVEKRAQELLGDDFDW